MRPAVQLLIDKGYPVKSVDLDNSPKLAKQYHVRNVPTFIVVDADGRELDRTEGLQPASRLAALYKDAKSKLKPQVANAALAEEPAPPRIDVAVRLPSLPSFAWTARTTSRRLRTP